MMIPTLHLNGSAASHLLEGYQDAIAAVEEAINSVANTAPHGRDYYVQSPAAYTVARDEHDTRIAKLTNIRVELQTIMEAVYRQEAERARHKEHR
jgi:hypothetical protein